MADLWCPRHFIGLLDCSLYRFACQIADPFRRISQSFAHPLVGGGIALRYLQFPPLLEAVAILLPLSFS